MVDTLLVLMAAGASPWPACRTIREFEYTGGRTDVVVLSDAMFVVAVEAKLTRWREALQQAYRNTCFAHRSFVMLPPAVAARAVAYRGEFERRGIGLCAVSRQRLDVLIEPRSLTPILPQLTTRAVAHLEGRAAA